MYITVLFFFHSPRKYSAKVIHITIHVLQGVFNYQQAIIFINMMQSLLEKIFHPTQPYEKRMHLIIRNQEDFTLKPNITLELT